MLSRAAWVAAGLGISTWLVFLDYRRRIPDPPTGRGGRRSSLLLDAGLVLSALGIVLRWLLGTGRNWVVAGCYLSALGGMALVAVYVAQTIILASDGRDGGKKGGDGES